MKLKSALLVLVRAGIVVLMASALSLVGGMVFLTSENKLLPLTAVNRTQQAARRCDCRKECILDPRCTASSSVLDSSGKFVLCTYSYVYVLMEDLKDEKNEKEAWTFIKGRRCPDSYKYVAGTGCIVMAGANNYTVAATKCPSGSQLASPPTNAAYNHLARYINLTILPTLQESKLFVYLGVKRINGVWTWLDGHVIPSTPGTAPWLKGDPNENTDCAFMLFNTGARYFGSLADTPCSVSAEVLCSLK